MNSLSGLQRWLQPYAREFVSYYPMLQVTSVRRSHTQQIALWNNRGNNPFPVAPPGRSMHEYGLAWDMVGPQDMLEQAGAAWNAAGGHWSPRDPIHFEVRI